MNDWMIAFVVIVWPVLILLCAWFDMQQDWGYSPMSWVGAAGIFTLVWLLYGWGAVTVIKTVAGWFSG